MQIDLILKNKVLHFAPGSPVVWAVSDNGDYQMHIDIQDERQNAMFVAFVREDREAVECTIDEDGYVLNENGERGVPMWALACPVSYVGVFSTKYATTPFPITVIGSIKRKYDAEVVKPDNPLIDQILEIVNDIAEGKSSLPEVTEDDNDKMLQVQSGKWKAVVPPSGTSIAIDGTLKFDDDNRLGVNTTNEAEEDNTQPMTSAGVYKQIGNIAALLETLL